MPGEVIRTGFPAIAATSMPSEQVVALGGAGQRSVRPLVDASTLPFGIDLAAASGGDPVTVRDRGNTMEITAGASMGAGADVGVIGATTSLGPISGGFAVGQSAEAANAGERVSVYIHPRKV